jgi:16S rRNA (guanine527-N7)-methyltransferase
MLHVKHGADSLLAVQKAAEYIGIELEQRQLEQFERFHTFLRDEAMSAGGVGPNETGRLWRRHIADAVLFGIGFDRADDCLDVGCGVGLPGIPLAILFPNTDFVLLDRAGRRVDMARRACSILGLDNSRVVQGDVAAVDRQYHRIVSRASLPPDRLMIHVKHLLRKPDGIAMIGLSHGEMAPQQAEDDTGFRTRIVRIPGEVLDTTPSLLRIEAT